MKTKIKSPGNKVTDFYDKKISKVNLIILVYGKSAWVYTQKWWKLLSASAFKRVNIHEKNK